MEPNYKTMWEELKGRLKHELSYLRNDFVGIDLVKIISWNEQFLTTMNDVEQRHKPKQYRWSEILEMSPLPKTIQSSQPFQYSLMQGYGKINYFMRFGGSFVQPSIQEMKNLWTIVE